MTEWGATQFIEDWSVPKGQAFLAPESNTFFLHPHDWLLQQGKGRLPFESRYNAGMHELERDRRRYRCAPGT